MLVALTTAAGALFGVAWYFVFGCNSGTCNITSTWWISTGWGAVVGLAVSWPHRHTFRKGGAPEVGT